MLISNYKEVDSFFSIEVEVKPTGRGVFIKEKILVKITFN